MRYHLGFLIFFLFTASSAVAQVEVFRGASSDTASYIAPEDTITRAPSFGKHPDDFYRYIENNFNMRIVGPFLSNYTDNVRFSFYVERNGNLSDFEILSASNQQLAGAVVDIVSRMPEWTPGKQQGKKKRTLMIYDINIQLVEDIPNVLVTKNNLQMEYSNKHKSLKWFLLGGSVIAMLALWINSQ